MSAPIDITGQTFGRWTVLERADTARRNIVWRCRCACGTEREVIGKDLRSSHSRSCGCLSADVSSFLKSTHRAKRTPEHNSWSNMNDRCYQPKNKRWAHYGGRGIKVCERWHLFENFLVDMGPRPSPRHSLDRINNDGDYEPGNCRWATPAQQVNNRAATKRVTLSLAELARIAGVDRKLLWRRLRDGWPVERAVAQERRTGGFLK